MVNEESTTMRKLVVVSDDDSAFTGLDCFMDVEAKNANVPDCPSILVSIHCKRGLSVIFDKWIPQPVA